MLRGLLLFLVCAKDSLCCITASFTFSNNDNGFTIATSGLTSHKIQGSFGSFDSQESGLTRISKYLALENKDQMSVTL